MILYGYYRSSTSYRVRIALNLKGVAYTQAPINLRTGEQSIGSFADLNPHKTVPMLMVDGKALVQSLAIIDWLEETYPDPSLLPEAPDAIQLCKELHYAVATEIHAPNNLAVLNYLRSEFNADQNAIQAWYATWVHRTFEPVEARLAKFDWLGRDVPFGRPSMFEIVLIPQIYNARRWKTDLSGFPLLERIETACSGLPTFQAAHPDRQPDAQGT